eukprot:CAMPEP_0175389974 /NCGR_PEP_ID=MMETSP0095-20121207/31169_1 /TAXON_ID=311494 /ORGANISM="Alexandrium monilatum, Strain CCMP3105" /LENGTH=523 /DNA_ID=CAMNT_0016688509 /DNA_START=1 /DNA_END=1572 /DNA_ORIENTATION=+
MASRAQPPYAHLEKSEGEARPSSSGRRWAVATACGLAGAAALALGAIAVRRNAAGDAASTSAALQRGDLVSLAASSCTGEFKKPKKPKVATELNGVRLDDVCIKGDGPYHVFIIGDWGGLKTKGKLTAVSHLNHRWNQSYKFVWPTDTECQFRVRDQMEARAPTSKPAYVLNVGDNFYWGGVYDFCGAAEFTDLYSNGGSQEHKKEPVNQFKEIFEEIYDGPGLKGLMWLGVLGNHDWGGWRMDMAWDQAIGYTWSKAAFSQDRWLTPALYYYVTVNYPDFSVDYYFMDTNVWDALPYGERPPHNICGPHNPASADCSGAGGPPQRAGECKKWFEDLWEDQKQWLDMIVPKSKANWRIVVTHFPPYWGKAHWKELAPKHELDAVITGHRHSQNMHGPTDKPARIWPEDKSNMEMNDFLDPTAWVVAGGGGGITSEHVPDTGGEDDQYGFVDMTLAKKTITFEMISHGGQLRRTLVLEHHYSHGGLNEVVTTVTTTTTPKPTTTEKEKDEDAKDSSSESGDVSV